MLYIVAVCMLRVMYACMLAIYWNHHFVISVSSFFLFFFLFVFSGVAVVLMGVSGSGKS